MDGEHTSNELPSSPPASEQRKQPLMSARQILQKHRRIQHQISPTAKRSQTHKQPQHDPIRRRPGHDTKHTRQHQRDIKRILPADDVRRQPPEQCADQHPHVDGAGHAVPPFGLELVGGLGGDDGLDEQDERVDGVAEAVEEEELHLVAGEADFVDGVVDEEHAGVEGGVDGLEVQEVAFLDREVVVAVAVVVGRGGGAEHLLVFRRVFGIHFRHVVTRLGRCGGGGVRIGEVVVVAVVGSLLVIVDKMGRERRKRSRASMYGVVDAEVKEEKHECTRPFCAEKYTRLAIACSLPPTG